MRVLQLGPYPPPNGGVQSNLVAIRDLLRARGHWAGVVNLTRHRRQNGDDVYYPRTAGQVIRLLAGLRYDILHLHVGGDIQRRLLALAALSARVPRAKTVLTFHSGGYPSSAAGRRARPQSVRGWVFRGFDRIIAVNQEIARLFERFGVAAQRIRMIAPHAVPPLAGVAYPPALDAFLRAHRPLLLTVGLLEPEYDLPLQIEALNGIRARHPGAGLLLAGAGSLEAELRARIASMPYAGHILLWGDLPHAVTMRAMSECDALLRTTLYDGDSIAVREALSMGTPVIATDNGMRPPGVRLIAAGDRPALEAAVLAELAAMSAARPRRSPQADHSNVEAVLALYEDLIR